MNADGERSLEITTADGVRLHACLAAPASPSGALILCHGITTNCDEHGVFPVLRDRALRAGLAVARFDFRAHGQSEGSNEQLRLAGMRTDLEAVVELTERELGPELPLIPVAVSFAGSAAVHVAATDPRCVGLVLWYAVVDYGRNFAAESPVPFTRLMFDARSERDPAWSAMPLVGTDYYLPSALVAEIPADDTLGAVDDLSIPILGFYGTRDKLIYSKTIRDLASAHSNIELHFVWGAGHGFLFWRPWVVRRTVAWASKLARTS